MRPRALARPAGLLAALALLSCNRGGDSHDHEVHHEEHSHGSHVHGEPEAPPNATHTQWGERFELYAEYQPLILGNESHFHIHLTDMSNPERFEALTGGDVEIHLNARTAKARQSGPGHFEVAIKPKRAGPCELRLEVETGATSESFVLSPCVVHADAASARAVAPEEPAAGLIEFSKESQWPIEFATAVVTREGMAPTRTVNAEILPVPDRQAHLTAATAGRLRLPESAPTIGAAVEKGQVLARIQPTLSEEGSDVSSLRAELAAARSQVTAAEQARDRLQRLIDSEAVSRSRLEEAESALQVARARLQGASSRLARYTTSAQGGNRSRPGDFLVKAPIAGTLVAVLVTEGETVAPGDRLFTVIDLERVWVEGRVFEPDLPAFENPSAAWFRVDGRELIEIDDDSGKLVTLGHVLDPHSRTVPVIFEVDNPGQQLRIGQFAKLSVAIGEPRPSLVIPEAAVLRDGNQDVVFVQVSGESFERRVVKLGHRSRQRVEVLQGLRLGDRVVTRGAYDVKLASTGSDAPSHGHAH